MQNDDAITKLINTFMDFQSIGRKNATRMTYQLLRNPSLAARLAQCLTNLSQSIKNCAICGTYCENEICNLCNMPNRDDSIICVIEKPEDLTAIENTGDFSGRYHILHGLISPLDGISPDDLKLNELIKRASNNKIQEIILAIPPSIEGEATAMYIKHQLKNLNIKITRLATGLPLASNLENVDRATIGCSLRDRREL